MNKYTTLILLIYCAICSGQELKSNRNDRKFPEGFVFGSATAAYQVEGAWNVSGKSESIWDHTAHKVRPCRIHNCSTGDVASDSYHLYKRDVEMIRELGLDFYRFSLAWTRILPTGFPDVINAAGVEYYNNLINELLKYNIEPMVTIYHWDLPQKLQNLGGWSNPYIVDWFTDYARVVFELFGDRVKKWITINEPREVCYNGYAGDALPPLLNISGYAEYMCDKNLLMANAKTWHMYDEKYRPTQGGIVGITIGTPWYEPASEDQKEAAEELIKFEWGKYIQAIFTKRGGYPEEIKRLIASKSAQQGFFRSRLPEYTQEEVDYIKGTSDFLGLNHYTTSMVYRNETTHLLYESPSYYGDIDVINYMNDGMPPSASTWLRVCPWGFTKLLNKMKDEYENPPIYIFENGFSSDKGLIDDSRVDFFRTYLEALLDAIDDGCNVKAYTAWSLMDNFEWMAGFSELFGLYEVDRSSPNLTRTPRKSAYVYKHIVRTRMLDFSYEPDLSAPLTIDPGH